MAKIRFDDKARICYIATYDNESDFYSKIESYSKDTNCDIIELRIDSIYEKEQNINKIIDIINHSNEIINNNKKYSLVTFRSKKDGGKIDLSQTEYYDIISKIYNNTDVNAIDIEYRYYKKEPEKYDAISIGDKTTVLSFHEFEEIYNRQKTNILLSEMIKMDKEVVKIAIFTHTKEEVLALLDEAKKVEKKSQKNIFFVIIAMGKMGLVSRIYNEYTNTKIIYIDNKVKDIGPIGNINIKKYYELRKKIKELI